MSWVFSSRPRSGSAVAVKRINSRTTHIGRPPATTGPRKNRQTCAPPSAHINAGLLGRHRPNSEQRMVASAPSSRKPERLPALRSGAVCIVPRMPAGDTTFGFSTRRHSTTRSGLAALVGARACSSHDLDPHRRAIGPNSVDKPLTGAPVDNERSPGRSCDLPGLSLVAGAGFEPATFGL